MEQGVYDFGLRLKELRERANLTQNAVAKKLGITVGTVKKYENNTLLPPIDRLDRLALLYNTSLDYLRNLNSRNSIYIDDLPIEQQEFIMAIVDKIKQELLRYDKRKV